MRKMLFAGTVFLFFYGVIPLAQAEEAFLPAVCVTERDRWCPSSKGLKEEIQCLVGHQEELELSCKQSLERIIQARESGSARGGGALTSFGGLNAFGPLLPLFSYEGRSVSGDPGLIENKAGISAPIYKNEQNSIGLSLSLGRLHLTAPVSLDSGVQVPVNFSRIEFGSQYRRQLSGHRSWGIRGAAGYAGDRISRAGTDASYSLNADYGFPGSEKGYWVIAVFISNNSPFLSFFPIPGVIYIYKTPNFTGLFGFPILSLQWTLSRAWAYSISFFGPSLQCEGTYGHRDDLQLFASYQLIPQSYIPSFRREDRDRLTFQEQRLGLGARMPVASAVFAEFIGGRSFGRSISLGRGWLNRSGGSTELPAGWWMNWGLKLIF